MYNGDMSTYYAEKFYTMGKRNVRLWCKDGRIVVVDWF